MNRKRKTGMWATGCNLHFGCTHALEGRNWRPCTCSGYYTGLEFFGGTGRILISKMEHAGADERSSLKQKLEVLNPEAGTCVSHYTEQEDAWWDSLLTSFLDKELPIKEEQVLDLENIGLTEVSLQSEQELILFLQGVVSGVFGDICRAKGYLPAGSSWLRFDVTDRTYSITGVDAMPEAKSIFIGRQLKRNWLREVLQKELYAEPVKWAVRPMRKRSAV